MLALTAFGGVSENSILTIKRGAYPQYTHLTNINQSQTVEPLSGANLDLGLPNRFNFKTASVEFIVGGGGLSFDVPEFNDDSPNKCTQFGYI